MGAMLERSSLDNSERAWSILHDCAAQFSEALEARKELQSGLNQVICLNHWWLTGELFTLEGKLGWSTGHIEEHAGDRYPPPCKDAYAQLQEFMQHTSEIPIDREVRALVTNTGDIKSLAARTYHTILRKGAPLELAIPFMYSRIAAKRTPYELGAARCFLRLYHDDTSYGLESLAGLTLILAKRLAAVSVRARATALRWQFRKPEQFCALECTDSTNIARY